MSSHEPLVRRGDYIRGSFVKPEQVEGYVVGVNPGDRSDKLGRFPFSESSLELAMESAVVATTAWARTPLDQRRTALRRYREALSAEQERFAGLLTRETGKPLWEARQEVVASVRAIDLLCEEAPRVLVPRILDPEEARSDLVPHGVVGVLTAWAMPLLEPTLHVAAALLAGNTVVFKPSQYTPAIGQGVGELLDRCRLPRGAFNLVQGDGRVAMALAAHPDLDALLYSGTHEGARRLDAALVDRPELPRRVDVGGKGAAVVVEGCDLERATYEVVVGAYLTAGQRPNSTARVFVTEGHFDRFVSRLMRRAHNIEVGFGLQRDVFMGPVASESLRSRYKGWGERLVAAGHKALLPVGPRDVPGRQGFYCEPALYWVDWQGGAPVLGESPPGPLLMVYRVGGWEEAVSLHNRLAYRAATSLFVPPKHPKRLAIMDRLSTGALNVNRGTIGASLRLPSAGLGRAGNGQAGGVSLLRFLAVPRSTLVERRPFDPGHVVPGVHWTPLEDTEDVSEALVSASDDLQPGSP